MAFNTLEYLEAGKVDFVHTLNTHDRDSVIKWARNSERREKIVKGFLPLLKNEYPLFCFWIIYDMDEYFELTNKILHENFTLESLGKENLGKLLEKGKLGETYLRENFERIIRLYKDDFDFILDALFNKIDARYDLLCSLSRHEDLHIRYLFMHYLLNKEFNRLPLFYNDITDYLTSSINEPGEQLSLFTDYMDRSDISSLAFDIFNSDLPYSVYKKIRDFIFEHYKYNELAYLLTTSNVVYISKSGFTIKDGEPSIKEFDSYADKYFATASKGRFYIYEKYSTKISLAILEDFKRFMSYFQRDGKVDKDLGYCVENMGLGRLVEMYVEKYLDLSIDKTCEFIGSGTTASAHRIGDYVFKLITTKWSYEDVICPDLYLIHKNLEEQLIRNKNNIVTGGFEIQKYLKRSAKGVPREIFDLYKQELHRLGYYVTDTLIDGSCGDNCRLLDSYLDCGTKDVAEWFKKYPVVLVDRDRVYENENEFPKQLSQGY